jgi:hypothetical protein
MGRRPKTESDKLKFRPVGFTPQEWETIDALAQKEGLHGGTTWVRLYIKRNHEFIRGGKS